MSDRTMTIKEAYLQASSFLAGEAVPDAAICAEVLLQHLLGWTRTEFLLRWEEPFPADREAEWANFIRRKAAGEPAQYITGEQEFYGLLFQVNPAVLIPRPETELLVEEIVGRASRLWPRGGTRPVAADIGTGSGAIAVTLAVQCPDWDVHAVDISPEALETALGNAGKLGAERIAFHQGDLLQPLLDSRVCVDILVSNPPYIPSGDMSGLQREVVRHEPHTALDGGPDGLIFYRRLVREMDALPDPPALVGFEVGMGQAEDVQELLLAKGHWREVAIVKDLAGIGRHVVAER